MADVATAAGDLERRLRKDLAGYQLDVRIGQDIERRTLASVYSVRPHPRACVSTPITWKEVDAGVRIEDFRIDTVRGRFEATGDLFKPLLQKKGRVDLGKYL